MKKLMLASFLLAGFLVSSAQNVSQTATLTSGGNLAGTSGSASTYYGASAGRLSTGLSNTFIGSNTGSSNTTGANNVYIGRSSGTASLGSNNTFTGFNSGSNSSCGLPVCTTTGNFNSFYGSSSGIINNGGNNNAFFGSSSGARNGTGSNNTYLGFSSGSNNIGSSNVFVGSNSGPVSPNQNGTSLSNTLYIDNIANNTPLIWGDFTNDQVKLNGKVGVGSVGTYGASSPFPATVGGVSVADFKLFVTGGIVTEEIRVALASTWADYVFEKDYNLKSLTEVEKFININGHLPNVPSAAQVKEEGINVAEMARIQQEKIEELTLYIIAQNKRIEALESKMNNK